MHGKAFFFLPSAWAIVGLAVELEDYIPRCDVRIDSFPVDTYILGYAYSRNKSIEIFQLGSLGKPNGIIPSGGIIGNIPNMV